MKFVAIAFVIAVFALAAVQAATDVPNATALGEKFQEWFSKITKPTPDVPNAPKLRERILEWVFNGAGH